jgi:hypothetical protein
VPRASHVPSAITLPLRIVTPIAVATARSVTPAQPTSASSSISAEQASAPEPPPALCNPAVTVPCHAFTSMAMSSVLNTPSARAGMRAASGFSR